MTFTITATTTTTATSSPRKKQTTSPSSSNGKPSPKKVKCPSFSSFRRNSAVLERDILNCICYCVIQKLQIKDRMYRLRRYKQCFVASEVIDLMLKEGLVDTRQDGIQLGIVLQKQMKLWIHVVDSNKLFDDDYLFFRLVQKKEIMENKYFTQDEYEIETSEREESTNRDDDGDDDDDDDEYDHEEDDSQSLSYIQSRFSKLDFSDTWRGDFTDPNEKLFIGESLRSILDTYKAKDDDE